MDVTKFALIWMVHILALVIMVMSYKLMDKVVQILMNALIIMLAVSMCVPTHQVHMLVVVMMDFRWMKISTIVLILKNVKMVSIIVVRSALS